MILVSCRKNFDSDKFLTANLQIRDYPAPDNLGNFSELAGADLQAQARNRHVCILVHGYSNTLPDVRNAYVQLQTRMAAAQIAGPDGYGLVLGFTWPGWWGPHFPIARHSANYAARYLLQLINILRPVVLSLDIQTHSLGARVALGALKKPDRVFIDSLLLTAPAVDNTSFAPGREFRSSLGACKHCFVYHSGRDDVLRRLFPMGDGVNSICPALGLNGPRHRDTTLRQNPNLYVVDCTACVAEHSGYRKAGPYYRHWARLLSGTSMPRIDSLPPT